MLQKACGVIVLLAVFLGDSDGLPIAKNITLTSRASLTSNVSSTVNIVEINADAAPTSGKALTYKFPTFLSVLSSDVDKPFETYLTMEHFLSDRVNGNHAREFHHTNGRTEPRQVSPRSENHHHNRYRCVMRTRKTLLVMLLVYGLNQCFKKRA